MNGNPMSWSEVTQDIFSNLGEMVRSEVRLAAVEVKEQAAAAGRASVPIIVGAVLGFYALGFALLCIVYALGLVLPHWAAALLVACGVAVFAAILLAIGRSSLKRLPMKPVRTIETMKETVRWAKNQTV